jgi:hypothetical protein
VGQTAENRKPPPLTRRGELLGTIALHCKTPPLTRRGELLGTISSTLQDAAAGMVDRLSPIDRNQEVPWPVG